MAAAELPGLRVNDLSWTIGGAQGSGVDSSATVFSNAAAYGGLSVYGKREYYSNIKGEHSYFQVRLNGRPIRSLIDRLHLLATFDQETIFRHARSVVDDGAIVYDPGQLKTRIADVPTLDPPIAQDLTTYLTARGLGFTVEDMLRSARDRGVNLVPVPHTDLLTQVANENGIDQLSKIARMVNMFAVAASFGLLDYEYEMMARALRSVFRAKASVAEMNVKGARKAYDHVHGKYPEFSYRLKPVAFPEGERRVLLTGAQAIGLGKVLGGMRFQTYYPITPASDESEYIEANQLLDVDGSLATDPPEGEARVLEKESVVVMQTEDEIAAITMAVGAALTGTRAATCTSGPGFCLMMEGIGWAGINEVPVVITLYQRAGPSTGMPTRHEQGDLRFALHAGHGDVPRIVLASGDFEEGFYDAVRAFNYAERYQMPVIHLVDKAIANSTMTMPILDPARVRIDRGVLADGNGAPGEYRRFAFTEDGVSPRAVIGQSGTIFWNTGDEHDERGHITEDPRLRNMMMEKRFRKLDLADREIPEADKVHTFGDPDAKLVLVSWGSTKGAILDAIDRLETEGIRARFLQVRLMSPFPVEAVARELGRATTLVNLEMNFGAQFAGLLREKTGVVPTHHVVKYNGRPMSSDEVFDAVRGIVKGGAPDRQVLVHGA